MGTKTHARPKRQGWSSNVCAFCLYFYPAPPLRATAMGGVSYDNIRSDCLYAPAASKQPHADRPACQNFVLSDQAKAFAR